MKKNLFFFILIISHAFAADVKVIEHHNLPLKKNQYFVQIGAFAEPDPILRIKNDYNIQVFTDERNYKIFVAGGFDNIQEAETLEGKLKRKGFKDAFIVLIQAKKISSEKAKTPILEKKNFRPLPHSEFKKAVEKPLPKYSHSKRTPSKTQKSIRVIWRATLILSFLAVFIILLLIIIRLFKRNKARRRKKLHSKFQQVLSMILFDEYYSSFSNIDTHFSRDLFNGISLDNKFNREVLIENIITLHKNLSGESSMGVKNLYTLLDLHKDSLRKLNSPRWFKKAQAIKELTEMDITDASENILKLTRHPNQIVRNEAQLSVLKLTNELPATFLGHNTYPLSEWQQLNILHILLRQDIKQIPDFSKYLESTNETIVEFSIKMINFFKQLSATAAVRKFTRHKNINIKIEAIRTLRELEDINSLQAILHEINNTDKKVRMEVVKSIGKLGNEKDLILLKILFQSEQDHDLLLGIIKAILKIEGGDKLVEDIKLKNKEDSTLVGIINHALDSRIS